MTRPRKDKFEETSIRFEKETEHELVYVSTPFFVKVTYKEKIGEYNDGKQIYGTTETILKRSISDEKEIKKEFREKGKNVIKIEEHAIPFPNICEKCHTKGIPRIERKSNKIDYHYRVESESHKNKTNRREEYWLIYDHRKESKKCRIAQFDKNHFLFKLPKNKISELHKHFFPFYLGWLKKELIA